MTHRFRRRYSGLQAKVLLADEKIVRFDIPMRDTDYHTVLVEICEALDETPTDLSDVARKMIWRLSGNVVTSRCHDIIHDGVHFRRIAHVLDCTWNESSNEITCSDSHFYFYFYFYFGKRFILNYIIVTTMETEG